MQEPQYLYIKAAYQSCHFGYQCVHTCTHLCTHLCTHIHAHLCTHVHTHAHIHMHAHMHIHTRTHTCIHMHGHILLPFALCIYLCEASFEVCSAVLNNNKGASLSSKVHSFKFSVFIFTLPSMPQRKVKNCTMQNFLVPTCGVMIHRFVSPTVLPGHVADV